jgi:hypothetical protein
MYSAFLLSLSRLLPLILVRNLITDMLGTALASQYNGIEPEGTPAANLPCKKSNTQTVH